MIIWEVKAEFAIIINEQWQISVDKSTIWLFFYLI